MSEHTEHTTNSSDCCHSCHAHGVPSEPRYWLVALALFAVLGLYSWLVWQGLPQQWTEQATHHAAPSVHHEAAAHEASHETTAHDENHAAAENATETVTENSSETVATESTTSENLENSETHETPQDAPTHGNHGAAAHENSHGDSHAAHGGYPPLWMIAPFAALLLCIAILPLLHATEHWWENNLHRFMVAAALGAITLLYYGVLCDFPVAAHWPTHALVDPAESGGLEVVKTVLINAIVAEYIPFIVLLFALFTITGGIRIQGDLKAHPLVNTTIIFIGAMLASFVGTTGAAMLLIRLVLETNKERKYKVHTIIFFIFAVCNCGGCLLPIGDPPLFLGYLKGVDFLWTFCLWKEWLFVNGLVIALYFLLDTIWFYPRESKEDKVRDETETKPLKIIGLCPNLPLIFGVVLAVMYLAPEKNLFAVIGLKQICWLFGANDLVWHPWYFLREAVQILMVFLSVVLSKRAIRKANDFNFNAIIEVAALFFGIFITMQAPLQILNAKGAELGIDTPTKFFWATGGLSSVLDNAPTYVVFFEAGRATYEEEKREGIVTAEEYDAAKKKIGVAIDEQFLIAIALGAVFMGAMTYIGNGPNFMVKAIAEQSGVKMPSFFGYMGWSVAILIPIFILTDLIFLDGFAFFMSEVKPLLPWLMGFLPF